MRIVWRVVMAVLVGALGYWLWIYFFPNDKKLIQRQLAETAETATFSGSESPIAQLGRLGKLAGFFTTDVELSFDAPREGRVTIRGRDEIMAVAARVRDRSGALKIEFLDVSVSLAEDRESATVMLTARAQIPGQSDFSVQEMKFTMKKIKRTWFISRVETVKTLSNLSTEIQLVALP
jgi:hypothetical protein